MRHLHLMLKISFFAVEESLLSEAVKEALRAMSNRLGEDKVNELLDKLQREQLKIDSKQRLKEIFDEKLVPKWGIVLAHALANKISKQDHLKPSIKRILSRIEGLIKEREE